MNNTEHLTCPHCNTLGALVKNGIKHDVQNYLCRSCTKQTTAPVDNVVMQEHVDQVQLEEDNKNGATVTAKSHFIPKTLEDLIKVCKIDLSVWEVDHYIANSWSVTTGDGDSYPNYQVKAWLIRKDPVKHDWPTIQPVRLSPKASIPERRLVRPGMQKALIIPDSQTGYRRVNGWLNPFHDRKAFDIVCQVAERERPDLIILLGDMLDMPMYSDKYIKSPDFYFTTQPALEENFQWFHRLAMTGAKMVYFEGNHELRLTNSTISNTIESYGLRPANHPEAPPAISIESLAGLNELGIEYIGNYPHGEYWINDNLRASHGATVRSGGGKTVESILKKARNSEIFGHIHRVESAHETVHAKRGAIFYGAYSPGTIARVDNGVVPANGTRQDWQQGFGMVRYWPGNGHFSANMHLICDGMAMCGDDVYESRPLKKIEAEMTANTGWDFITKE
ncbi:MAG: hypothetical protein P1S60_07100 [Anaerolineae bacterium]|nr:hypothetical protein [Anaerolineae bacterium]